LFKEEFSPVKENKEKMVVSFIAFTCSVHLLFFFFEEKKKRYIAKTKKKTLYAKNMLTW
jgi:hypothetical protein